MRPPQRLLRGVLQALEGVHVAVVLRGGGGGDGLGVRRVVGVQVESQFDKNQNI